jgi:hypothetical protein
MLMISNNHFKSITRLCNVFNLACINPLSIENEEILSIMFLDLKSITWSDINQYKYISELYFNFCSIFFRIYSQETNLSIMFNIFDYFILNYTTNGYYYLIINTELFLYILTIYLLYLIFIIFRYLYIKFKINKIK